MNPFVLAACQLLLAGALTYLAITVWRAIAALRALILETQKEHRKGMISLMVLEHNLAVFTGRYDLFFYNPDLFKASVAAAGHHPPEDKPTVN